MVDIKASPNTSVTFNSLDNQTVTLDNGSKTVVWTTHVKDKVELKNSELVFIGYGIVAPQYNWNDYEGLDAKGKTVVILVNDPGYATQNPDLFTGNVMTYYGRRTYKYKEAAKKQKRYIAPDPHPKADGYFCSDYFSFAIKGVPALYIDSGVDMVKDGKKRGEKLHTKFVANNYHNPSDEYNPGWVFERNEAKLPDSSPYWL